MDPNILRISFEEIQEFHNIDFTNLLAGTKYYLGANTNINGDITYVANEFLSAGGGEASKQGHPIILNAKGFIDNSFLDASNSFYFVGGFTPEATLEYPDVSGETSGAFWLVEGLVSDYTFTSGDLTGRTAENGSLMIYSETGWSLLLSNVDPTLYYKLDGTQAITASFAGGGNVLANIADGVQVTDAATVGQVSAMVQTAKDESEAGDVSVRAEFAAEDNAIRAEFGAEDILIRSEFAAADDSIRVDFAAADDLKEDSLGLGTAGQVLATNAAADGKEWIAMGAYDDSWIQPALDTKVDNSQVLTDVPAGAVFTDTVYDDTAIQAEVDLNTAKETGADRVLKSGDTMAGDLTATDFVLAGGAPLGQATSAYVGRIDALEARIAQLEAQVQQLLNS